MTSTFLQNLGAGGGLSKHKRRPTDQELGCRSPVIQTCRIRLLPALQRSPGQSPVRRSLPEGWGGSPHRAGWVSASPGPKGPWTVGAQSERGLGGQSSWGGGQVGGLPTCPFAATPQDAGLQPLLSVPGQGAAHSGCGCPLSLSFCLGQLRWTSLPCQPLFSLKVEGSDRLSSSGYWRPCCCCRPPPATWQECVWGFGQGLHFQKV